MAKHASSSGKRFLKLAGMTASIASKSVANSIRNLTADEEQKMQHVANFSKISEFKSLIHLEK